jgi:hypothetical protein
MERPSKDVCLTMAEYQFKCRNEEFMWRWLFEWATWEDDMQCHVERKILKQRRSVMTEEQVKRFNETFPEFNNVLGRSVMAWVEAEVMEKLAEQFDQVFDEVKNDAASA